MALITGKITLTPTATGSLGSGTEGALKYDSTVDSLVQYGTSWGEIATPVVSYDIEFLVVAGGGGGAGASGGGGGGGGAGGYRTLTQSVDVGGGIINVIVGDGGLWGGRMEGTVDTNEPGGDGGPSSISGAGVGLFQSTGGGGAGGGGAPMDYRKNGRRGGSGGGGAHYDSDMGTGNLGGYTPVEGYNGGDNQNSGNGGGAGGGAGAAGGNTYDSTSGVTGGVGLANDITGSSVFYAGGGAGNSSSSSAPGGNGGGGATNGNSTHGSNGTDGKGGGGGGAYDGYGGGMGGSGVVILRMLSTKYTGTTTGSPTVTTDSSHKVLKFLSSGSYTV